MKSEIQIPRFYLVGQKYSDNMTVMYGILITKIEINVACIVVSQLLNKSKNMFFTDTPVFRLIEHFACYVSNH